ncbi:MAG: hypothetical protein ACF788_01370 [Novipirellula sp. JB048]
MTSSPYIQVAGKSNILIGFAFDDYATMHRIGEQIDETRLTIENVTHDVPGDSGGGPQGDPIEQQVLAHRVRGVLNLSKWDHTVREMIEQHGVMNTPGKMTDAEIGAFLLRDRSFRIAISPSKSNPIDANNPITTTANAGSGKDHFFRNFPCCTLASPLEIGQGTKFSALQLQFRAWRTPEGHKLAGVSGENIGVIWNWSATGIDDQWLPASMKVGGG